VVTWINVIPSAISKCHLDLLVLQISVVKEKELEKLLSIHSIYTIGISIAVVLALIWSFILDKNKPPTIKEFVAKLLARGVLIVVLFVVVMGFLDLAFALFRES